MTRHVTFGYLISWWAPALYWRGHFGRVTPFSATFWR